VPEAREIRDHRRPYSGIEPEQTTPVRSSLGYTNWRARLPVRALIMPPESPCLIDRDSEPADRMSVALLERTLFHVAQVEVELLEIDTCRFRITLEASSSSSP
jgi:hypothetical protein